MCTTVNPPDPAAPKGANTFGSRGWEDVVLHDLRTPLAVVSGQAQLIKRQLRQDGAAATVAAADLVLRIDQIERSASRIAGMLDELQELAGGLAPKVSRQHVDLVEVAHNVVADVRAAKLGVRIRLHRPVSPLIGCWEVSRLERALANLVGNAAKYTTPGGEIVVAIEREQAAGGDWAVLSVRDEGIGIPAADLPHIFEAFYRASNVASSYDGTGLGLVGVRHTVEQHGGSISVASCEGQGSTFTVRLPLVSAV